jgi:hypothetical protein
MDLVSRRDALVAVAAGTALAATGAVAAGEEKEGVKAKHDVKQLGERIDLLSRNFAKLASEKDFKELMLIIHKPGWTTPAEFALVHGIVESMLAHSAALVGLKESLLQGSRAVGTR